MALSVSTITSISNFCNIHDITILAAIISMPDRVLNTSAYNQAAALEMNDGASVQFFNRKNDEVPLPLQPDNHDVRALS